MTLRCSPKHRRSAARLPLGQVAHLDWPLPETFHHLEQSFHDLSRFDGSILISGDDVGQHLRELLVLNAFDLCQKVIVEYPDVELI
jgi:hypothetical protein